MLSTPGDYLITLPHRHHNNKMATAALVVMVMLVTLLSDVGASVGDKSAHFIQCTRKCYNRNCTGNIGKFGEIAIIIRITIAI